MEVLKVGLFTKYCEICGKKVDKKTAPQRFDKYFCSEEHSTKYLNQVEAMRKNAPEKQTGGCC